MKKIQFKGKEFKGSEGEFTVSDNDPNRINAGVFWIAGTEETWVAENWDEVKGADRFYGVRLNAL